MNLYVVRRRLNNSLELNCIPKNVLSKYRLKGWRAEVVGAGGGGGGYEVPGILANNNKVSNIIIKLQ